jgi:carbon-monoxide dehydrogenase small subunit
VGVCGVCTALLDGEPISTCILLAPLAEGREITTVEGLGESHPVQEAFVEAEAFQCGYCTPGMILAAQGLLAEHDGGLSEEDVRHGLEGNFCRCTGYQNIVKAVQWTAAKMAEEGR